MYLRKSTIFLSYLAVTTFVLIFVFAYAAMERKEDSTFVRERLAMAERYGLTDLCLFTDARTPTVTRPWSSRS